MFYPYSDNKGADQLRGYREADLRLCFRLCRLLFFPCGGSYMYLIVVIYGYFTNLLKWNVTVKGSKPASVRMLLERCDYVPNFGKVGRA